MLLSCAAEATSFDAYKQQTNKNFTQEKSKFSTYKAEQKEAFNSYIKGLEKYWKKPILTSKKVLVSYSKDKKSRTFIDFEHNKLKIQTLAKNRREAEKKLKLALAKAVTFDTKDFYKNDDLEQKLVRIENSFSPCYFQEKTYTKKPLQVCSKESATKAYSSTRLTKSSSRKDLHAHCPITK